MLTISNFERFKIFHRIYQKRSIQKSAEEMHVTRSAVSQSLKLLEEELGFSLFLRDSKNFRPTAEADQIFQSVDMFIEDLQSQLQKIALGLRKPAGLLRLGAPNDFGSGLLTRILGKFRKNFPDIRFEVHLAVPVKQLEMLSAGQLDIAFIDNGDIHAENFPVKVQPALREEFVLIASEKLLKRHSLEKPTLEKLKQTPFVDYLPHAPVTRMWFKHHFDKNPETLNIAFSAESVRAVLNAVLMDIGAGVVPRHLLVNEFKSLKVIEHGGRNPFINQIMIARSLHRKATAREEEFLRFYLANAKEV